MIAGRLKDVYKTHIMAVVSLADMQTGRQIDMPYSIIAKRKYNCISSIAITFPISWLFAVILTSMYSYYTFSKESKETDC